ncbi:MAG: citrate synthase [Sandaracinaceae bacterium]|nr:citrate synthase [Sandaracinaceae bacterium]
MNQPDGIDDPPGEWLDAPTAAAFLGVRRETLYAYVARGRLRSRVTAGRARAYAKDDLARLAAKTRARAGHAAVAAGALAFGEPVLDSAITHLDAGGPAYRGHPAIALAARGLPFEPVAELLVAGALPTRPPRWPPSPSPKAMAAIARLVPPQARPLDAAAIALAALGARFPRAGVGGNERAPRAPRALTS